MPRLLLGLASLAVAAALVPARHPYSYTYNVLDLPSNNNYQVIRAVRIVRLPDCSVIKPIRTQYSVG